MKILKALPIEIAPVILMNYGGYLGQLHQSGYDIAGNLFFTTGALGLALGLLFFLLSRKYPWHGKWWVNFLTGLAGRGITFIQLVLSRLPGL